MDGERELDLIDLGDAKEETNGIHSLMPKDENPVFPFGVPPPSQG